MKRWNPRDAVAVLLALGVLFFIMNSTLLRPLIAAIFEQGTNDLDVGEHHVADPVVIQAWKDIVNVIIGALAGYIGGHIRRPEDDKSNKS